MTKRNKIIIITVAAILALAVIVGLVFLLKGNSNPAGATPTDASSNASTVVSSEEEVSKNVTETVKKIDVDKDSASLTVENIEAERGKEIIVPVTLSNNPGIAASAIEIQYNGDKLTYNGYTEGEVFENYLFVEKKNSLRFSNIENGDVTKNGVIFNLKFKVKEDAVLGDTEIKINVTDESFLNFDEEFVNLNGGNAIVTVK